MVVDRIVLGHDNAPPGAHPEVTMQLTAVTALTATSSVTPGTVLGNGTVSWLQRPEYPAGPPVTARVEIAAGVTLLSGVHDVRAAALELQQAQRADPKHPAAGLVAFVRTAPQTWDAVALLAPTRTDGSGVTRMWSNLQSLRVADGIEIDAIWQVSGYGRDMGFGASRGEIVREPR